jgi:chromate transport protein ChrA
MAMDNATTTEKRGGLAEVAKQFLLLGFIAYGGPAAHVAMMEEEFVRRGELLTREKFLDGVNAAAVALMAFVGWQFGRAALVNVPAVILAVLSAALIFRYKINSTWIVLGGAAAGILLRLLGWS